MMTEITELTDRFCKAKLAAITSMMENSMKKIVGIRQKLEAESDFHARLSRERDKLATVPSKKVQQPAKSPEEIEAIPEFDKTMRGIVGTPKNEIDQQEKNDILKGAPV